MLDIIVTSSCRKTIVKTTRSFFDKVSYSGEFRLIVHIDVLDGENVSFIKDYLKKLESSERIKVDVCINANPSPNRYEAHAKAVGYLFSRIETPYYFHLEDDWIFLKHINLDPLISVMKTHPDVDHIRFSRHRIIDKTWLYYISDEVSEEYIKPNIEVMINGLPLVQVPTWSFNPHLGRTSIVKNYSGLQLSENPEKYVCRKYSEISSHGKLYILGRIGDKAIIRDIGRNRIRQKLRKIKYILTGGRYPEFIGT